MKDPTEKIEICEHNKNPLNCEWCHPENPLIDDALLVRRELDDVQKIKMGTKAQNILHSFYTKKAQTGEEDYSLLEPIYDMADYANDTVVVALEIPGKDYLFPVPFPPRWILKKAQEAGNPGKEIERLIVLLSGGKTFR